MKLLCRMAVSHGIVWYCVSYYGMTLQSYFPRKNTSNGHPSLLLIIGTSVEHRLYAMGVPLYFLCLLWGSLVVLLAFTCLGGENHALPPRLVAAYYDLFDLAENDSAPPLATRYNEDDDDYESFDLYATMDAMDEEDWNDMDRAMDLLMFLPSPVLNNSICENLLGTLPQAGDLS